MDIFQISVQEMIEIHSKPTFESSLLQKLIKFQAKKSKNKNRTGNQNVRHFQLRLVTKEVSQCAISAISTYVEALNFNFLEIFALFRARIYRINKMQSPKLAKMTGFQL